MRSHETSSVRSSRSAGKGVTSLRAGIGRSDFRPDPGEPPDPENTYRSWDRARASPSSPTSIPVGPSAPKRPLQWADLAAGRLRLDRLCRNGADRLSSPGRPPQGAPITHSSRAKKIAWLPSSAALRPLSPRWGRAGCGVDRLRPLDPHRGRNGAGSRQKIQETSHGDHRHLQEDRRERVR